MGTRTPLNPVEVVRAAGIVMRARRVAVRIWRRPVRLGMLGKRMPLWPGLARPHDYHGPTRRHPVLRRMYSHPPHLRSRVSLRFGARCPLRPGLMIPFLPVVPRIFSEGGRSSQLA